MTEAQPFSDQPEAASLIDPASLHILIVDASHSSRQHISSLLRDCSYQVTACKTSHEAIQILKAQQGPDGNAGFDLILKEHSPSAGTNACRLLRSAQREPVLKGIPIIVASTQEDRDVMVSCLQLGAADYMLKPLRHNELRNLWARVYWWRRAFYLQQQPSSDLPTREEPFLYSSSGASDETKCDDEEQQNELAVGDAERSGEGSAPNGSNGNDDSRENGSRANGSKNGSKTGVNCSRTQAKDFNGNGNSGAMGEGNGHSATKAEQGSNNPSRGAAPGTLNCYSGVGPTMARQESAALTGTAEGVYVALSTQMQAIEALADAQATAAAAVVPTDTTRQAGNGLEAKAAADLPEPKPLSATIQQPRPLVSPPGFRAYVSKENLRKRSSELVQKVEDDSSGSGRTTSQDGAKRRPVSKLGNSSGSQAPVSEAAASDATVLLNRTASGPVPPLFAGSSIGANGSGNGNGNGNDSAWSGGMQNPYYSNYPYGMVPPFGVLPQYWGQMPSSGSGDAPDMSAYFSYAAAQQNGGGSNVPNMCDVQQGMQQQQLGMQQQQLAMHNQLMYQHSFMMQQYGMPGGGYPSFPSMLQNSQQGGKPAEQKQKGVVPPAAPTAVRPVPNMPAPMSQQAAVSGLQGLASNARQMPSSCDPTSGLTVGTGTVTNTATGTTLGTAVKGGNTGATSHNTAPVLNAEGCLVEPSRKERRAQALHKYKQKRKNLCFTKKIRYESRKQLAQARPRVKGQFVRVRADDVGAVAEAMAIAQEHGTMSGDAVVPQLALLKAGGNQEVAAELMAAAEQLANPTVENTEEDDFDEEDYGEEDDVNSPAENSVAPGASKAAPTPAGGMVRAPSKALEDAANVTGRHSSDSGSNSPDIKARAGRS